MKLVKLKCEGCGATLKVNEELKKVTCNYCGTEFFIDDEVKRVEITKNEKQQKIYTDEAKIKELEIHDRINKRNMVYSACGFVAIVLLMVVLPLFMLLESEPGRNGVRLPQDAKKYKGENYEVVVQQLEDAGFEDVEAKPVKDLVTGWITKDGSVESVSIAGDTEFEEGDIFSIDAKVVVTYHTFKKKK